MSFLILILGLLPAQDPEVATLIKQLEDDSALVRDEAAKALLELGDKAVAPLKTRMAVAEGNLRKTCSEIIERIAIPKNLRGVLPPITRVTLDAKDRSLRDVLADFQNQTRTPMKLGRAEHSDRWPKVTVHVENAAPLEALNSICRAARYYWHIQSGWGGRMSLVEEPQESKITLLEGPELHFAAGDYDKPRLFIRHYQVEIWEIVLTRTNDFRKGRSRGELSIGLAWPAGVKPHSVIFEVSAAIDDLGNQLVEGHDDPNYPKGPAKEVLWGHATGGYSHRYRLKVPESKARSLKSVVGKARLFYALRPKTVTFESPETAVGKRKEVDRITAEIMEFKVEAAYSQLRLRIDGSPSQDPPVAWAVLDSGKKFGPFQSRRVMPGTPPGQYDIYFQGIPSKPVALEILVDTECVEDSFDFEFKDVPLP